MSFKIIIVHFIWKPLSKHPRTLHRVKKEKRAVKAGDNKTQKKETGKGTQECISAV